MYFFLFVLLLRDLQDVLYIILLETSKEDYYPLNNNRLLFIKRTYNCGLSRLVLRKENKLRLHEKSFVVPNRIWMLNRSVSSALPCFFGSSELISFIRTMPCQIIILLQLNLKLLLMLYKRMTLKVFFFLLERKLCMVLQKLESTSWRPHSVWHEMQLSTSSSSGFKAFKKNSHVVIIANVDVLVL